MPRACRRRPPDIGSARRQAPGWRRTSSSTSAAIHRLRADLPGALHDVGAVLGEEHHLVRDRTKPRVEVGVLPPARHAEQHAPTEQLPPAARSARAAPCRRRAACRPCRRRSAGCRAADRRSAGRHAVIAPATAFAALWPGMPDTPPPRRAPAPARVSPAYRVSHPPGADLVGALGPRPAQRPVEDVAAGQAQVCFQVERGVHLDARLTVAVATSNGSIGSPRTESSERKVAARASARARVVVLRGTTAPAGAGRTP